MAKRKTGTREWADSNYNIGIGCSNGCLYCYAKTNAERFKLVAEGDWTTERIKNKLPAVTKREGWVMFPTTHDITPFYLDTAVLALKSLLEAGNKVLIVSKPNITSICEICDKFEKYKDNILFRFSIGTRDETKTKLWEPGAPLPMERYDCLKYAFLKKYATSVSMEPFLGNVEDALTTFNAVEPFVTDKIWIGKMNKIDIRVKKSSPEIETACNEVFANQTDDNIMWLVNELRNHPKIEWKDSIKEVIEKYAVKL
jgi:DNA repair photolyase